MSAATSDSATHTRPAGGGRPGLSERLAREERAMLGTLREVPGVLAAAVASACRRDARAAAVAGARASELGAAERELQDSLVCLLAREAPVAGDLRRVIALMAVGARLARMSIQCGSIARMAVLLSAARTPSSDQLACVSGMAEIAALQVLASADAFERRDAALASELRERDRWINRANTGCFKLAVEQGHDSGAREAGMLLALIARAIERVGDNAVDVAEQGAFVVAGELGWEPRPAGAEHR